MSKTQYQIEIENGSLGDDIHLVKPLVNEEYFIIPKDQALKELSRLRDITKTTNERTYQNDKKINTMILAKVYGGYGTSQGGAPPGTEGYFNKSFPPNSNSAMGSATTPKIARARLLVKENLAKKNKKERSEEFDEFDKELNELKGEREIAEATGSSDISGALLQNISEDDASGIEIGQNISGVSALSDGDTPPIVEAVTGGGNNITGGGGNNISPLEAAKPAPGTKVPPIIINHAECGHLTFGDEKKNSNRARDVGLYAGDSNALRLFRDGGFELRSSESQGTNQTFGSNIMQVCDNAPLTMNSEGDIYIKAKNKLVLRADHIVIESTHASTEGVVIKAKHDINIRADNNIIMTSDNITLDAKERILSHSEGWQILIGQYVRLHEPQTKICPAFLKEYIDGQIKTLKG